MQPESVVLFGPMLIVLTLLLFPRHATNATWRPFKWLVMYCFSLLAPNDIAYLRQRLVQQNPRTRTDWFWRERVGAFVMLVLLVGALYGYSQALIH